MNFKTFFQLANWPKGPGESAPLPYPYQERFAEADTLPHLLRAPTAAGKTATAVLGWLWRWVSQKPNTPRRLVYCLPMRVLVEQSARAAEKWILALHEHKVLKEEVPVHVLMGGAETEKWYLQPEKPAVLIGTQDMLLSRALNRGYAANRFHWPIDFGLLNNDCLWVFDEPQLMGSGVSTSAQLAGLRTALGTFGPCPSVWMSATLEPGWLDTVDFRGKFVGKPLELGNDQYGDDYDSERPLYKRMTAAKTLSPLGMVATKDGKDVAAAVVKAHEKGTQTLVIVNTVDRAKAVYAAIKKEKTAPKDVLLVHSRFRPHERELLNASLQQAGVDRIIVATQVVEAGVDISARTLVTELAPWASVVQRVGRCNRTGDDGPGRVFWIDLDEEKQAMPYAAGELIKARDRLRELNGKDVSPKSLTPYKLDPAFPHTHVIRRRDVLDLFDTSPDLSGNDIDVSRFVRGDKEDIDVQVFWRDIDPKPGPDQDEPGPRRQELCAVPVGQFREFVKKREPAAFRFDYLDDAWVRVTVNDVRPGLTILLPTTAGGYDWNDGARAGTGWNADSTATVTAHPPVNKEAIEEAVGSDLNSALGKALTIAEHTENVVLEMAELVKRLGDHLPGEWLRHFANAARWHDAGKAHCAFQQGMRRANASLSVERLWAKSGTKGRLRHGRPFFRHELASALAALQHNLPFEAAYLIASHHGRTRLAIRALPGEIPPDDPNALSLYALGVHHGDKLPKVDLGGKEAETCPETSLDLGPMQIGGESSWTANALKLLAELGPFCLAYLEALLRAADVRASKKEAADV